LKVAAYEMIVFRWSSYEAVVFGRGYMAFTFEVVLTFSVSFTILGLVTDIYKTFQSHVRACILT